MDWQHLLQTLGIAVPPTAGVATIIAALLAIVGAFGIGWYTGRKCGEILSVRLGGQGGWADGLRKPAATAIIHYSITALLLLVASSVGGLESTALLMFAGALGLATGLLLYHLARALRASRIAALIAGGVGLGAGTIGTLGGMAPLITALERIAFQVGDYRFSLLLAVNALITIGILILIARVANHFLVRAIGRASALDSSQKVLVQKLGGIVVIVVAVLLGIDLIGIDLTALAVFSGALGLGVGFGLQKTFGNLISGLILLMDRSIKPGDVIVVGDTFGMVDKIGVRAVSVITRDSKEHLIPNEKLMTEPVENWSYTNRNVRLHIPVGVSYSSDIVLAQRLMFEAASAPDRILTDPKPAVWLKAFGDSSIDHEIRVWISDPEMGLSSVRSDILNRIWVAFREHGIEIPFPQRDVHIRSMPSPAKDEAPTSEE